MRRVVIERRVVVNTPGGSKAQLAIARRRFNAAIARLQSLPEADDYRKRWERAESVKAKRFVAKETERFAERAGL